MSEKNWIVFASEEEFNTWQRMIVDRYNALALEPPITVFAPGYPAKLGPQVATRIADPWSDWAPPGPKYRWEELDRSKWPNDKLNPGREDI